MRLFSVPFILLGVWVVMQKCVQSQIRTYNLRTCVRLLKNLFNLFACEALLLTFRKRDNSEIKVLLTLFLSMPYQINFQVTNCTLRAIHTPWKKSTQ